MRGVPEEQPSRFSLHGEGMGPHVGKAQPAPVDRQGGDSEAGEELALERNSLLDPTRCANELVDRLL
jgi:hypothetical protein